MTAPSLLKSPLGSLGWRSLDRVEHKDRAGDKFARGIHHSLANVCIGKVVVEPSKS